MRIAITGSGGLIGKSLTRALKKDNHQVIHVTRSPAKTDRPEVITWHPEQPFHYCARHYQRQLQKLDGLDAIVHLAGENIAGLWTAAKKQRIYDSRIKGTSLLAAILQSPDLVPNPPKAFLSASACGLYGDHGSDVVTEQTPPGTGFLANVCADWEAAAGFPNDIRTRTVNLRFGIVLADKGGALAKMLPAFRFALGGKLGPGSQYWPWITLEDATSAVIRILQDPAIAGPVNVTSPEPVTNAHFTKALAKTLRRPAFMNVPEMALKLLPGHFAQEMLLTSARVIPQKLIQAGFDFKYPKIEAALERLLA